MLSIIKTAIITITISFISGVLLDYYKNYAPRILCDITRGRNIKLNNKRIKVYTLTIMNKSKKTIHDLNINLKAYCDNLKIDDAKITSGLKYDLVSKNYVYDVSIPFLSKNDKFSVKLYLESLPKKKCRPIITLRSPENFKRIDSSDGIQSSINDYKNSNENNKEVNGGYKGLFRNKKLIISIVSVLILSLCGILAGEYFVKDNATSSPEVTSNENKINNLNNEANNNQKGSTTNKETTTINEKTNSSKNNNLDSNKSNNKDNKDSINNNSSVENNVNNNKSEEKENEKNSIGDDTKKSIEDPKKDNNDGDGTKSNKPLDSKNIGNNSEETNGNNDNENNKATKTP